MSVNTDLSDLQYGTSFKTLYQAPQFLVREMSSVFCIDLSLIQLDL